MSRVTLKLATSLDGRIATATGESRWITGELAREQVHRLRAEHDAVVVGIGTVLADDPMLNVRLQDHEGPQPTRVVLDTNLRLPRDSRLVKTVDMIPTIVVTATADCETLEGTGVKIIAIIPRERQVNDAPPYPRTSPERAVQVLEEDGLHTLMIEGGGEVAASFLRADLIDRLEWFRAPIVLGSEGRPALGGLGLKALKDAPRFRRVDVAVLGDDLWERYERV